MSRRRVGLEQARQLRFLASVVTRRVDEDVFALWVDVMEAGWKVEQFGRRSVGPICMASNRATETQIASLVQFAQQVANNRILLLPDCDEEGESGFKDLLWKLAEAQVQIRLGPTSKSHGGQFAGKQPEDLTIEDLSSIQQSQSDDIV